MGLYIHLNYYTYKLHSHNEIKIRLDFFIQSDTPNEAEATLCHIFLVCCELFSDTRAKAVAPEMERLADLKRAWAASIKPSCSSLMFSISLIRFGRSSDTKNSSPVSLTMSLVVNLSPTLDLNIIISEQ